MLYFAYGANLNLRGMKRRCPRATPVSAATLKGYRLEFRTYATIVADAAAEVLGALYELTPQCWRSLDDFEGDDYEKITITVDTAQGAREATAYIMKAGARGAPSVAYFTELARGYTDWKYDAGILRRARYALLQPVKPEKSRNGNATPQLRGGEERHGGKAGGGGHQR
jgi:gamma-glutamylcyclotransferase (GGCT)/AIG2-like uncharacterized protein YtfP